MHHSARFLSPLFNTSARKRPAAAGAAVTAAAKLQPLAFFDANTFRPRATIPLSVANVVSELRENLPTGVRLIRSKNAAAGGVSGPQRGIGLLAVTEDFKVVAEVQVPLCVQPPSKLPVDGWSIDNFAAEMQRRAEEKRHVLICACAADAVGFAIVDTSGQEAVPEATRTFVAGRRLKTDATQTDRDASLSNAAQLLSATKSFSSQFFTDVEEHVDRFLPYSTHARPCCAARRQACSSRSPGTDGSQTAPVAQTMVAALRTTPPTRRSRIHQRFSTTRDGSRFRCA
jgi:hypothetical protein